MNADAKLREPGAGREPELSDQIVVAVLIYDARLQAAIAEQFSIRGSFSLGSGVAADVALVEGAYVASPGVPVVRIGPGDAMLVPPFRFSQLAHRLRAAVAGVSKPNDQVVHELLAEEGPARRLTEKEAAILRRLVEAAGRTVTREQLLQAVWGYRADTDTHTIETHIYRLRRKIERNPLAPERLVTAPGGYRLV